MLEFNESKHEYTLDGKKLISVTQLMQKYGLAPDYSNVSPSVLQAKANYGKLIHEEIEQWIKYRKIGFSKELVSFVKYLNETGTKVIESEYQVYNDVVAGTIDLLLERVGQRIIADIKTTYQIHKESVSWQLSIYLYLYIELVKLLRPQLRLNYNQFKGECYHFNKDGELNVVEIPLKPESEVEKLIQAVRDEKPYEMENTNHNEIAKIVELEKMIKYYDEEKKKIEIQEQELKEAIIKGMEESGLTQIETDNIKITYMAESIRVSLDSKAIKEKHPEIYNENLKETKVKAQLRITLKEKNE